MFGLRVPFALGAVVLSVCLSIVAGHAAGPAEMRVDGPAGTQAAGVPFEVRVSITRAAATWAGYATELIYDTKVVRVNSVKPGGIADCKAENTWGVQAETSPTIVAACVFQATEETGTTEIIEFECLKDGSSSLHLVTPAENPAQGTGLFDADAVPIGTDLVDGVVTCGAGGPIETIAVPTNPPPPGGATPTVNPTDAAGGGTPTGSSPGAGAGTPGVGGSPSTGGAGTSTAGGAGTPSATGGAARTAVSKTAAAQGGAETNDSGDSSTSSWLIAGAVVVVLALAGGAGWVILQRRRGAASRG